MKLRGLVICLNSFTVQLNTAHSSSPAGAAVYSIASAPSPAVRTGSPGGAFGVGCLCVVRVGSAKRGTDRRTGSRQLSVRGWELPGYPVEPSF